MNNITDDEWNQIRDAFLYNMSYYNIEECLSLFIKDYNEILNLNESCEEEESLDVYFERKIKPMWDYVYNLQKQINKIEMHKPVLIPSVSAPAWQNPPAGRPPYDLDWYKVTCDANGNAPLGGNSEYQIDKSLKFRSSMSDYLSRTPSSDGNKNTWTWTYYPPKFTPEQIKEWSNIRFDDPSQRK